MDDDECVAVGRVLGRGNRSFRRNPAPIQLCPPQIPHDLARDRTRVAEAGSQRQTAGSTLLYFKIKTPWSETSIELYRPSDRRLLAK
jgi:hypothetical protein